MREELRVGIDSVETVTTLLQRIRSAHPTKGLFEAADLQWWWRTKRSTDELGQLFWFDDDGLPVAAVILVDWGGDVAMAPMIMPDTEGAWVGHVIKRGLAHAADAGIGGVDLEVDRADQVMHNILLGLGFTTDDDAETASVSVVEAWLPIDARPEIGPLYDGYRLLRRSDPLVQPHHLNERSGPDVEERLRQTSLYRADLDLLMVDQNDNHAAHGLFWHDPVTSTGLVEPMRTEDEHQRRGLARAVLTTGLDLLAEAGAERVKLCFEPDNPPARELYLSVGFEPVKETVVFSGSPTPR